MVVVVEWLEADDWYCYANVNICAANTSVPYSNFDE